MTEPTQEQIKEFWERRGYSYRTSHKLPWENYWADPEGNRIDKLPPIDLNNLFKYAVPKLFEMLDIETQIEPLLIKWIKEADLLDDKKTTLALFWALKEDNG